MVVTELLLHFDCQTQGVSLTTARIMQEISRNCGKLREFLINLAFLTRKTRENEIFNRFYDIFRFFNEVLYEIYEF